MRGRLHVSIRPEPDRIIAKVDELIPLCDQLENSLHQAQKTQIQLTDAVVENALLTSKKDTKKSFIGLVFQHQL